MSAFARTSAASAAREASPVPQTSSKNAGNEPQMKKAITGKLFRLDSPRNSQQTLPVPRINGEGTDNSYRIPSMVFDNTADDTNDDTNDPSPIDNQTRSSPTRKQSKSIPGTVRRVSDSFGVLANDEMPPRTGALSPSNENQWSSAVGHATLNGKSGRVIERLMAENDRLKREYELQKLRTQELERNLDTMKPQMEALRTENDNLNHANSMDVNILARRDRKIEQLKEEVAVERSRREAAELLARKLERQNEESKDSAKREIQMAQEEAKHATTHATIMEQSFRQLRSESEQRARIWNKDLAIVQAQRKEDHEKYQRVNVVGDQLRSEVERARKMQVDWAEKWDAYQKAHEDWKAGLDDVANYENGKMRKLSEDMETITNKMKWVMALENTRVGVTA